MFLLDSNILLRLAQPGHPESFFRLHLDTQPIYREWLRLVETYSVSGLKAHDARIVAAMKVHGLADIVTFNVEDFRRYHGIEITVLTPMDVVRSMSRSGQSS